MSAERLESIFGQVTGPLKELLKKISKTLPTAPPVHDSLKGGDQWDVSAQAKLCKKVRTF